MVAVAKNESGLVRLLIENGADINARTDDQKTALTIAEAGGLATVAELLVKAGAKKSPRPSTPPCKKDISGPRRPRPDKT
jgi:ankyrin repeat protein